MVTKNHRYKPVVFYWVTDIVPILISNSVRSSNFDIFITLMLVYVTSLAADTLLATPVSFA